MTDCWQSLIIRSERRRRDRPSVSMKEIMYWEAGLSWGEAENGSSFDKKGVRCRGLDWHEQGVESISYAESA